MAHETIGRYALHGPISSGGMASVHYGRLLGPIGFARTVAIKRLHAGVAADPDNAAMFLDEARLSARIHHPNVVATMDIIEHGTELLLVMDYVAGPSLSGLVRIAGEAFEKMPAAHAVAIVLGALHGLHAAHEAKGSKGERLDIVHRDVSPQNILVGDDGVPRLIDFGIAKAVERVHLTRGNEIRGKILYMAPEQLARKDVDRRADVYAVSVVLWELLANRRLIDLKNADDPILAIELVRAHTPVAPSRYEPSVSKVLDAVVLRGLSRDPKDRFETALEMAIALEAALAPSSQREVAVWVSRVAADLLRERAAALREIEAVDDAVANVVGRVDISMVPPMPSSRGTFGMIPDGHTGKVWAQTDPPARRFDARPLAAFAVAAIGIVVAWVAGAHSGASTVVVNAPEPPPASAFPAADPPPDAAPRIATSTPDLELPPTPKASAHRPTPRPKGACNPPYTIDAKGIKVPKPECR